MDPVLDSVKEVSMVQIVINYNGRMKYFNVPYGVARAVDVLIHDKSFDPAADDELDKIIEKEAAADEKKSKAGSSSHHGPLHDLSRIDSV